MSILRDDQSVARQEVLEAGWACVHHLEALAATPEGAPVADALTRLAQDKTAGLEQLAERAREAGELPVLPDRDRETLDELIDWALASFDAEGGVRAVLRQRIEAEQRLEALLQQYLDTLPFAPEERSVLLALHTQASAAQEQLAGLRDRADHSDA